jgi:hypothetical protein
MPYIVFLAAPEFEILKEINQKALSTGTVNKKRTVGIYSMFHREPNFSIIDIMYEAVDDFQCTFNVVL